MAVGTVADMAAGKEVGSGCIWRTGGSADANGGGCMGGRSMKRGSGATGAGADGSEDDMGRSERRKKGGK